MLNDRNSLHVALEKAKKRKYRSKHLFKNSI